MDDSPWILRIVLLLIGAVVVAAIYIFNVVRHRRRNRYYEGRVKAWPGSSGYGFESTDLGDRDPTDDEVIAVRVRKIEPEADLPAIKNEAAAERPPQVTEKPTPAKKREDRTAAAPGPRSRRNRGKTTQMDLGFDETALVAPELVPERPLAPAEPIILTLYLRPRHGPAFVGPSIVRNANVVGLRHGNLQIFHHFGAGDLRTDEPLFSLANMFEPGNFDLQRIEAFQTAGLVMFLNLPAALDGPVSFELFLNTAQRLAEGLHGELLTDPQTPLDSTAIEQMRRAAAAFVRHAS